MYKRQQLSGVPVRTIENVERNGDCKVSTAKKLAEALNVTPKKLFDFDDEFVDPKITKEKLFDLINKNEDKIQTIYNIVKGYLN